MQNQLKSFYCLEINVHAWLPREKREDIVYLISAVFQPICNLCKRRHDSRNQAPLGGPLTAHTMSSCYICPAWSQCQRLG